MQTAESVNEMDGVELEYALAEVLRFAPYGFPRGPFAMKTDDGKGLKIIGAVAKNIHYSSFSTDLSAIPFFYAQELGAMLSVEDGQVKCIIGESIGFGESYIQAIMRALVIHHSLTVQKSSSQNVRKCS